jgi:hypothetical protein
MKNRTLTSILAILIILSWSPQGMSLVEETHQVLNEHIARTSINGFSLNDYLISNLGLGAGVAEIVGGVDADGKNISKRVFQWLGYGGFQEDRPGSITDYLPLVGQPTRSVNHFHNPLGGLWQYSGLNAEIGPLHYTGQSSILWAQNPNQDPGGKWSWYDARKYYYTALTGKDVDGNVVAPTKEDRDPYFAKTFRAIGQLMHLVHDASVPAHVRNQVHILFNYEKWVEKIRNEEERTFNNFIANPTSFDPSILNLIVLDPQAPIPIANIMDTDKYGGSNPDITAGTAIGIAEYTNANFFNERTIFSDNFAYPARSSVEVEDREIPDPRGIKPAVMRPYYIKKRDGERGKDPEQGYRLATAGVLYKYITTYFPIYTYLYKPALDGGVYSDYASLLLPRAVGYSAGLLGYFFRGNIAITLPDTGVYAQTENRDEGFKKVTLNAQNTSTTGEEMTDGSIELVVKYRLALKDPFQSYPVPTTWEYSYIVVPELNNTRSIPRVNPIKLEFDLSSTPIPIHATDIYLQVVYKGKLGQEEGAVAVGFKDISEPTPIDIYNDMDRKCINGSWYVAGSPEALALGNQFNFDAYPHHLRNIYLRFSSTNNPQGASSTDFNLHIPSLDAGDFFIREAFVLSDYRFNYGYRVTVANANPNDPYVTWFEPRVIPYTGIKNQTEYVVLEDPQECAIYNLAAPCGIYIRYYPIFNSYRGQEMWLGVAFPNASYPPGSSCP